MKRSCRYSLPCLNIPLLSVFLFLLPSLKIQAEEKLTFISKTNHQVAVNTRETNSRQVVSTSTKDLLAKQNNLTRVTGVELNQILTWDISSNTSIDFYGQYISDRETTDEGLVAFGDGVVNVPKERFLIKLKAVQRDLGRGFQAPEINSGDSPLGFPHERLHQEAKS